MANNVGGSIASGATLGATIGTAIPIPGVGTLGGALIGGTVGLVSGLLSKKPKRPVLSENPYTMAALNFAKNEFANKGLTGGDVLQNKLDNTTSTYINNARASNSGADFLSGLSNTMGAKYAAEADLAYRGALEDKQDLAQLQGALGNSAADKDRVDNFNIVGGYQDELARQRAEQEGMTNAIGDVSSIIAGAATAKRQGALLNELYGQQRTPVTQMTTGTFAQPKVSLPTVQSALARSYYNPSLPLGGTVKLF